jgi:hypothetical protein
VREKAVDLRTVTIASVWQTRLLVLPDTNRQLAGSTHSDTKREAMVISTVLWSVLLVIDSLD